MSVRSRRSVLSMNFSLPLHERWHHEFEVKAGERVRGLVELLDGENLDVFLLDRPGLAHWLNGREFTTLDGARSVRACSLDATSEENDVWSLAVYTGAWLGPSTVTVRVRLDASR